MNDVMQGRWTLLHVIGLVVWQKHVKSLFGQKTMTHMPSFRFNA